MLQGINFLSGGQDNKPKKILNSKDGGGDFVLSNSQEIQDMQGVKEGQKKEQPKEDAKIKTVSKPKKVQSKSNTKKNNKNKVKSKLTWWRRLFKVGEEQVNADRVARDMKDNNEVKVNSKQQDGLVVTNNILDEGEKAKQDFIEQDVDEPRGLIGKRDSVNNIKFEPEALTLSQLLSRGEGDNDRGINFDINLMPEEKKHLTVIQRIFVMLIVIIIMGGLEYLGYILLKSANNDKLAKIGIFNEQLIGVKLAIDETNEKAEKSLGWYMKMSSAKELLKQHKLWSRFFTALEVNTHINTYYVSLNATQNGAVVLNGVAKDYKSLAQAILGFEEAGDFMKDYKVSGVVTEEIKSTNENEGSVNVVAFLLSFTVNPEYLFFEGIK